MGPTRFADPRPSGLGGQPVRLGPDRGDQPGPGIGGHTGIEAHRPVVVGPVPQVALAVDGLVGGSLVLTGGLHPPAPQLQQVVGLGLRRVDEVPLGLGLEDGCAGDLLDL
jgi:hypothetical protein